MEDKDLRDFFAGLAMIGLIMRNGVIEEIGDLSYEQADKMLATRNGFTGGGILAIKRKK